MGVLLRRRQARIKALGSTEGTQAQIHALLFTHSKSSFTRCISSFSLQEASFWSNCCSICMNRNPQCDYGQTVRRSVLYCSGRCTINLVYLCYTLNILICFSKIFFPVFASCCVSHCSKANVKWESNTHFLICTTNCFMLKQHVLKCLRQAEVKPTKLCHGRLLRRSQQNICTSVIFCDLFFLGLLKIVQIMTCGLLMFTLSL